MTTLKSTCPRDCYDSCGMLVTAEPGKRVRVIGDPEHAVARGSLCAKCGVAYNGVFQDESARLLTPLRRTGQKGSGEFEPISWDLALSEIADRLGDIASTRGEDAVLTMNYSGTMSLLASGFPNRFVNAINASEVDYGTICNRSGFVALDLLFGSATRYEGFDPRTAKDAACIVLWGANPAHSGPHAHKHWLADSPAKVLVIDPVRTRTADVADLHLRPRPGTDAALAFGLLNALRSLGAFDDKFIENHVMGADELDALIDASTPEWAEAATGVPAAAIRDAASMYSAGPAMLWCGQSLQRQPQGGNIMRAAGLLPALTGNVGKPGTGFYYVNGVAKLAGVDDDYLEGSGLRARDGKTVLALELADRLADPDEFLAFMVWNTNPLASAANLSKLRDAVSRDDLFTVSIDLFMTDTARYADIVLPAASFLEFDDMTAGYFNLSLGVQSKIVEPPGEALPNQEIFRRLAIAMGRKEPALVEADSSILDALLGQIGFDGDFEAFRERGVVYVNGDEPRIAYENLSFDTPSGRIEVASDKAVTLGLPRLPHAGVDDAPADGLLRLLSPASEWRLNDTYANDPRLARRAGEFELTLHPDDAARLEIASGDTVRVSNDCGEVTLTAEVSDCVLPGTVMSYKGRWPSRENGHGSLNELYDGRANDMGESTAVHGVEVQVTPAA